jgi:ribose transport system permease protein
VKSNLTTETIQAQPLSLKQRAPFVFPRWSGAFAAIVVLMAFTTWREPAFLKWTNLVNIASDQASVGILAVGMTLVITTGGIDLSVGSLLALSGGLGVLTLNRVHENHSDLLAVICAVAVTLTVAVIAGAFNGLLTAKGRLAAFIATLGAFLIYRSAAGWIANGGQFFAHPSHLFQSIGEGFPLPGTNISRTPRRVIPFHFPYPIVVWAIVALIAGILLNRTRLGRYMIAVGNNERAALYSAIAVDRVKIISYCLLGLLTGMAAFLEAAKYNAVNSANTGMLYELYAIAAAVIGGTRMQGGSGSIFGAVIGALLLGVIHNVIVMMGNDQINTQAQGIVTGIIILVAALAQRGKKAQ